MADLLSQFFSSNFAPHVYCLRNTGIVPLDAASDLAIAASYMLIPAALVSFFRQRRDLQFSWIFVLFGIFILSCGFTHVMDVVTLWYPIYRVEAAVKVVTAISSAGTAFMLWRILPDLLAIPSPEVLKAEINERIAAEKEVRRLNTELEARVAERTAALQSANANLISREQALRQAEERLRLALDAGNIGIWDHDLEAGTIVADHRCREAFGVPDNRSLTSEDFITNVHSDDRDVVRTTIQSAMGDSIDGRYKLEYRTIGVSDNVIRHVHVQGRVLFHEAGTEQRRPLRLIGTLNDITEYKRQQDALLRANHDLRQFAFAAAHDLQEPLRNVSVSLQLLDMRFPGIWDEDARDLMDQSIEGAQRVNNMLKDLLLYTRVIEDEEGRAGSLIDSGDILDEALSNLKSRLQETSAEIVAQPLPKVTINKIHLAQLFQNLIGNALKYHRPEVPPRVEVQAHRNKDKWQFEVRDNGIGFDPAYAEKIFGMFKRLNGRREYPGNGIGLAICSRIVAHYGGSIWAESEPGKGSTFRFTLPAA